MGVSRSERKKVSCGIECFSIPFSATNEMVSPCRHPYSHLFSSSTSRSSSRFTLRCQHKYDPIVLYSEKRLPISIRCLPDRDSYNQRQVFLHKQMLPELILEIPQTPSMRCVCGCLPAIPQKFLAPLPRISYLCLHRVASCSLLDSLSSSP